MKRSFLLTVVVVVAVFSGLVRASAKSPKDIVEQFVKMNVEGTRLTPQGWHDADALFGKPSEPPQPKVIVVIAWRYAVSDWPTKENTAEFYMGYEEVGRLNTSSLHFAPSSSGDVMWSFSKYAVVLANLPLEWRIDGVQPTEMHLTADAAIRYVNQMRTKISDPTIQKNADQTLDKLSRFRKKRLQTR
jgi:hypothetical protein